MNDLDRIAEAARSTGCHEPSDLEPAEGIIFAMAVTFWIVFIVVALLGWIE